MTAERIEATRFDTLGAARVSTTEGWRADARHRSLLIDESRRGRRPYRRGWWARVLVMPALAGLALLVWFAVERIEDQVERGARLALEEAGTTTDGLVFVASFRDVEIGGILPPGSDAAALEALLEAGPAPNGADIRTARIVAERRTSPFDVRVSANGQRVAIRGTVPLASHRELLISTAAESGLELADDLDVAGTDPAVDPEAALAPLLSALRELGPDVTAAELHLTDTGLDGEIELATPAARTAVESAVVDDVSLSAPSTLDVDLAWDGTILILDGFVADTADADRLTQAAVDAVGSPRVIANMKLRGSDAAASSEAAPIDAAIEILGELGRFTAVDVHLEDTGLSVAGQVIDPDARIAVERSVAGATAPDLEATLDLTLFYPLTMADERDRLQNELDALDDDIRENVRFDTDDLVLDERARATLDDVVRAMNRYQRPVVEVGGHTDSQGPAWFNEELSQRRAASVVEYLRDQGIDTGRLNPIGYGESRPIAENLLEAGRAQNRRVEFTARASF